MKHLVAAVPPSHLPTLLAVHAEPGLRHTSLLNCSPFLGKKTTPEPWRGNIWCCLCASNALQCCSAPLARIWGLGRSWSCRQNPIHMQDFILLIKMLIDDWREAAAWPRSNILSQIAGKQLERVISSAADGKWSSVMQTVPSDCLRPFVRMAEELPALCSIKHSASWRIPGSSMCQTSQYQFAGLWKHTGFTFLSGSVLN